MCVKYRSSASWGEGHLFQSCAGTPAEQKAINCSMWSLILQLAVFKLLEFHREISKFRLYGTCGVGQALRSLWVHSSIDRLISGESILYIKSVSVKL
jgi:hypothetical protein